jgi:hypothetical protein
MFEVIHKMARWGLAGCFARKLCKLHGDIQVVIKRRLDMSRFRDIITST